MMKKRLISILTKTAPALLVMLFMMTAQTAWADDFTVQLVGGDTWPYTGNQIKPNISSVYCGEELITNYEVISYGENINVGKGSLIVKILDNRWLDAEVTKEFDIIAISGTCGSTTNDNVTWAVADTDGNGSYETLTISGTGAMKNYGSSDQPWAAFKDVITTIVIGDGVTRIGSNAFNSYTALTSVTIASSVTIIGASAFNGCTNLATISGASGVTNVGAVAFDDTAWKNALPDGLTCVGHVAYRFKGDDTSVTLDAGTTQIADYCFYDSKITSIIIPASVERIEDFAFARSVLESVIIPASVERIGNNAFASSALQKMYVLRSGSNPADVTSIGENAFESCEDPTAIIVPDAAYNNYSQSWGNSYSSKLQRGYTVTGTNITATSYAPIVAEDEIVTLSYTGEVPAGCEVRYSLDGGTTLLVGNTFQMPAANVTVTAVMNGPDQPFVVTTWDDLLSKMATGGYIRLDADVDPSNSSGSYLTVPQDVTVTLDLNDHTIDQKSENATKEFGIFIIAGALTLNDSGTGGTITGGKAHATNGGAYYTYGFGGCVFVAPTGTFTMNGGTISGNTTDNGGGGVYVANSDQPRSTHEPSWNGTNDYNMKLGTTASIDLKRHISGFPSPYVNIKSTTDPSDSDIDPSTYTLDDDIFTFTPTAIGTYNFVFSAAGYNISYSNVQIVVGNDEPNNPPTEPAAVIGGTFTMNGGTISGNRASYDGGGVYVEDGCTFTMNGGTISGNTANNDGGGVYANWGATVNLNGGTITGNTASNDYGRGGGVMLKGGMVTVSGSPVISGNTKSGRPNNLEVADSHYLRIGTLTSGANIGVTTMTVPTTAVPVTFTKNAKDGDLQYFFCDRTGYALGTDADGQLTVNDPNVATTPWAALQTALNAGGTVTLTEDVTQTDYDVNNEMTELNISGTVTLDLKGHTITGIRDYVIKIGPNDHLTLTDSGTGGTITGGQSGVSISAANSSFTMTGGTITGNHGGNGGVYVSSGTFSVSGKVVITGNTDNSGNARNVYLTTGKVINVTGSLSGGTCIGVTTKKSIGANDEVTITNGLSGNSIRNHFRSDNDDVALIVTNAGELALVKAYTLTVPAGMTVSGFTPTAANTYKVAHGDVVTLEAPTGYVISSASYNDGTDHEITPVDDVWSFTMPTSNVTVTATLIDHWDIAGGADGSETHPYVISSPAGLDLLASNVNAGNDYNQKYFVLKTNITYTYTTKWNVADSQENNFTAIGIGGYSFSGIFDGKGFTIRGIRICSSKDRQGLIGCIGDFCGIVRNVTLDDVRITGETNVGGIAGLNSGNGTIENCRVTDKVLIGSTGTNPSRHGGIVGRNENESTIKNCLAIGAKLPDVYKIIGAIVGVKYGTLSDNYYYDCTVGGNQYDIFGTGEGDVTANDGAVPATELADEPVGSGYITCDGKYYAPASRIIGMNASGIRTFASTVATDFTTLSSLGLTAYIVSAFDGTAGTLTLTAAGVVPAETGLLLKGTASTTFVVPFATDAEAPTTNYLVGVTDGTTSVPETTATNTNFILANGTHGINWYTLSEAGAIGANKAYLSLPTEQLNLSSSAPGFTWVYDGETTSLKNVQRSTFNVQCDNSWYTLDGRKLDKQPTQKGIYVVNGKKVVIK